MQTQDEFKEWCIKKLEKEFVSLLDEMDVTTRDLLYEKVPKLMELSYEYGFSQGCVAGVQYGQHKSR